MKIIIYLGHPAQYHFFKNIVNDLKDRHEIKYLIKTKEVLEPLLVADGVKYKNVLPDGRKGTKAGIGWGLVKREVRVLAEALNFRPKLMIGGDPAIAHVGRLLGIPVIIVSEDDAAVINDLAKITFPFTSHIIAPYACNCGKWNYKKIGYAGYMKLAYLHPKQFKRHFNEYKSIALIRTSKLDAYHDSGIGGLSEDILIQIINHLKTNYTVLISSEADLNPVFLKYTLKVNPNKLHNILANSAMLISDSQSMSMEAAMLGIPSIRYSDFAGRIGVLEELEHKYGLTFGIKTGQQKHLFRKLEQLLSVPNLASEFQKRRQRMLDDKIDVKAFMVWFIENYPESAKIMNRNPDYQHRFH
jgi:predicted glycosyltransferase